MEKMRDKEKCENRWREREGCKVWKYYCREEVGVRERLWWNGRRTCRKDGKWSNPTGDESEQKDWLRWAKVRKGERERRFYRIWKWVYLIECVVAAAFQGDDTHGSWSVLMWTLAGSFMWTSAQRQWHPPFTCPVQHGAGRACRREGDLMPDYMHVCLPAALSLGCLGNFEYKFALFTGIQFILSHSLYHTRASNGIR